MTLNRNEPFYVLDRTHPFKDRWGRKPITLQLELDDVEYILSMLDEEPQDSREYRIHEEIFTQVYE